MELLKAIYYIYSESPPHNGKWILADCALKSDGILTVQLKNGEKNAFQLSSNCVVQAPVDTVFHRVPPLPFRRSVREAFSIHVKKGYTTWFLASSEEERDEWCNSFVPFINRKPPPYGDYDNWTSSTPETDDRLPKPFQPRRSFTPQHRTGFYSVQPAQDNSCSLDPKKQHPGFYSSYEPRRSLKFPDAIVPQHRSGFYSVHEPKKKTSDEPTLALVAPSGDNIEQKDEESSQNMPCKWCCIALASCCGIFSSCLHQCCMNFAAAL